MGSYDDLMDDLLYGNPSHISKYNSSISNYSNYNTGKQYQTYRDMWGQTKVKKQNTKDKNDMFKNWGFNNSINTKYRVLINGKQEKLELGKQLGKGGEGTVYNVSERNYRYYVAKIYHKIAPEQEKKINYMIQNKPTKLEGKNFRICWPEYQIVDENNKFVGYLMKKGFDDSVEVYELTKQKVKNKNFKKYEGNNMNAIINRLKVIYNMCLPLHYITNANTYVMVDMKPQNVLTDINGKISILDTDSFQISENFKVLFNARVATPEYTPKEYTNVIPSKIKYSNSTDMFAVGVTFYQIIMGIHPYVIKPKNQNLTTIADFIYNDLFAYGKNNKDIISLPPPHKIYTQLPTAIQDLFNKTFTSMYRPTMDDWGQILSKCINKIVQPNTTNNNTDTNKQTHKENNVIQTNQNMTHNEKKVIDALNNLNSILQNIIPGNKKELEYIKEYTKKLSNIISKRFNNAERNYNLMTAAINKLLILIPLMYIKAKSKTDIENIKKFINIIENEVIAKNHKLEGETIFKIITLNKDYGKKASDIIFEITENLNNRINNLKNDGVFQEFISNEFNKTFVENYEDIQDIYLNLEQMKNINQEYIEKYNKIVVGLINFIFWEKYNDIDINDKDYNI